MNKFVVLLSLLLFSLSLASQKMQPIANSADFEVKLKQVAENIRSVKSNFRQEKTMRVFSEKMISSGMFYYLKPDKISLQYDKPVQYAVTINGGKLQTVSGGKKTTINLGTNKMMAQMRKLIEASMIGNISALSGEYDLQYFQSDSHYFVKIVPRSDAVKTYIKEIGITFDKRSMGVEQLRMTEKNEDYTDYIFSDTQYNTLKSDEIFSLR